MTVDRRGFLRAAAGVGLAAGSAGPLAGLEHPGFGAPPVSPQSPDVVVIGAGAFGAWTALYLRRLGASVTLVDQFGPANSRSTSGGETRGVRTGYGDREHGELWSRWAKEAIVRWKAWDEEWRDELLPRVFFPTGDLIMRPEIDPFMEDTKAIWDRIGVRHELIDGDELRYRYPVIGADDIEVALFELDAGVVRARRAIESVARVFTREGGTIRVARALPGESGGGRLSDVVVTPGDRIRGSTFVFALGPWMEKVFPVVMERRLRTPMGHVFYFGTPPGDDRFSYPNMPSYNFRGVTGWAALPQDHRGFRVRAGGRAPEDPDESVRWIDGQYHERPREILRTRFPLLADAPIMETRACHYESSITRNFIIDRHPDLGNVWITGGGSAEAFKQGPVLGEYIARRVLGMDDQPELAEGFRLSADQFDPPAPGPAR